MAVYRGEFLEIYGWALTKTKQKTRVHVNILRQKNIIT